MLRVAGGSNGDDSDDTRNLTRHRQTRGTAKTMPDQESRAMVLGGQELGCPPKVLAIGAKVGVLEDAFAISQSSEVIPQHTPTAIGQSSRYANDPFQVFVAGEAMGEEQPTTRF